MTNMVLNMFRKFEEGVERSVNPKIAKFNPVTTLFVPGAMTSYS
jgi:hypothetical protein